MYYSLGKKIQDGGEGVVYRVHGYANLVIKIYHEKDKIDNKPIKTRALFEKLQWMVKNQPRDLIERGVLAWPVDLYFGNSSNRDFNSFQGFVMPCLNYNVSLEDAYTYRHPIIDNDRGYVDCLSVKARIELAIDLCDVFGEIQKRGFVIGDFNKDNIGVRLKDRKVAIMDCDSFHLVKQTGNVQCRCNRVMSGYLAPEIIEHSDKEKEGDLSKLSLDTFTSASDNFCLAIHIFNLLMNGVHPYNGVNQGIHGSTCKVAENDAIRRFAYVFRPGKEPFAEFCLPRHALPEQIADLFDLAFIDGRLVPSRRPTAEQWLKSLKDYLNSLKNCETKFKHQYYAEFKVCPYCIADIRYEEKTEGIKPIIDFPSTFAISTPPNRVSRQQPIPVPPPPKPPGIIYIIHKNSKNGKILRQEQFSITGRYGPYTPEVFPDYKTGSLASGSAPASGTIAPSETKTIIYQYSPKKSKSKKIVGAVAIAILVILMIVIATNVLLPSMHQSGDLNLTPASTQQSPVATTPSPSSGSNGSNGDGGGGSGGDNGGGGSDTTPTPTLPPSTPLSLGTTVQGSITTTTNSNRYSVVLTEPGRLRIEVSRATFEVGSYVIVRWFNSAGVQIRSTDYNFAISSYTYNQYMDLEAGTYYVEIAKSNSGGYSNTGVYTLTATLTAAANDDVEPNNSRETAQLITSSQTLRGFLSYQDSTDFYRIDLSQASRVRIEVSRATFEVGSYVIVRWFNSAGVQIRSTDYNFAISSYTYNQYMDLEAGTYYVEIAKSNSGGYSNTGVYTLTASIS